MKSPYCIEPGCDRWALSTSPYCMSHLQAQSKEKRMDSQPTVAQRPLKRISSTRRPDVDRYNREVSIWKRGKICLMCEWDGLKKPCEHCHHAQGREGALLLDKSKWVPLCAKHHIWVTEHSKEAIALGISLPRNQ